MTTIYDVAKEAKVSIKTVSRVMNEEHKVKPNTKKIVLEAMKVLDYSPSFAARTMVTQKTGLIGLTRYIASYWAENGVRCNAICPGGVENGQSEEFLREISSRIPMNRLADSSELQGVLLWMLSDASSYLNGAVVPIDGGRTVW